MKDRVTRTLEEYLAAAMEHRRVGEIRRALEVLRRACEAYPRGPEPRDQIAELYYEQDNVKAAAEEYLACLPKIPSDKRIFNNLGVMWFELDRFRQAYDCFRTALKLDPRDGAIACNLALTLQELGLGKKAVRVYQGVQREFPGEVRAHFLLGMEAQAGAAAEVAYAPVVGTPVQLIRRCQPFWRGLAAAYPSRVEEVGEDRLVLTTPMHEDLPIPLRLGARVIVGTAQSAAFRGFTTTVLDKVTRPRQLFAVENSPVVQEVQRRRHYRIFLPQLLQQALPRDLAENPLKIDARRPLDGNLSAGGLAVISNQQVPAGSLFELQFAVDRTEMAAEAVVIRCGELRPGSYKLAFQFRNLSASQEDRIARFVLEKQLARRRSR